MNRSSWACFRCDAAIDRRGIRGSRCVTIRIGNAAGFLGDNLDAPRLLAEAGELDYLTLEYLAELTLSILARVREKNPQAGYAGDFLDVLQSLLPRCSSTAAAEDRHQRRRHESRGVCRGRGRACWRGRLGDRPIGVVTRRRPAGRHCRSCRPPAASWRTWRPASRSDLASCAGRQCQRLSGRRADRRSAGRRRADRHHRPRGRCLADASGRRCTSSAGPGTIGTAWPAPAWRGTSSNAAPRRPADLYRHWEDLDLAHVGYPIAELEADGSVTITKPAGTGGRGESRHGDRAVALRDRRSRPIT